MADNTVLPGTGETYRSKDRAGVKAQVVGLDLTPGDASETLMGAANPLPSAVNKTKSVIDSSTANLNAAAVYTTQWFSNELGGTNYQVTAKADQPLTITHEPSWDGSTVAYSHDHFMDAGRTYSRTHGSFAPYHRYKFTNTGGSATTSLFIAVTQSFAPQHQVEACPNEDLTVTPLTGSATYTSGIYYSKYRANGAAVFGKADQSGTIYLDGSHNSVDWEILATYPYTANAVFHKNLLVESAYFRLRWVNGGVAQGSFKFHVLQKADPNSDIVSISEDANGVVASGDKEHNTGTPSATAIEALTAVAKAAAPTYTEGQVVLPRTTLSGDLAVTLDGESVTVTATNLDVRDLSSASDSVTVVQATGTNLHVVVDSGVTTPAGSAAHGASDSGNPIKIGGRADSTFQTAVTDGQRVDALFDVYGVQRVRGDHPNIWQYHENSSSALTDASVQAAPGAGLSVHITDIVFSTGAATACNIFLEEGTTTILGPYYLEGVAGRGLAIHFNTPHKCTANTAVTVTTSAAIAHGLDIKGFIAP